MIDGVQFHIAEVGTIVGFSKEGKILRVEADSVVFNDRLAYCTKETWERIKLRACKLGENAARSQRPGNDQAQTRA